MHRDAWSNPVPDRGWLEDVHADAAHHGEMDSRFWAAFIDPALDHNMPPAAGTHTIRDLKMVELGRKKPEQ